MYELFSTVVKYITSLIQKYMSKYAIIKLRKMYYTVPNTTVCVIPAGTFYNINGLIAINPP